MGSLQKFPTYKILLQCQLDPSQFYTIFENALIHMNTNIETTLKIAMFHTLPVHDYSSK